MQAQVIERMRRQRRRLFAVEASSARSELFETRQRAIDLQRQLDLIRPQLRRVSVVPHVPAQSRRLNA
jgi:hypothetical protein